MIQMFKLTFKTILQLITKAYSGIIHISKILPEELRFFCIEVLLPACFSSKWQDDFTEQLFLSDSQFYPSCKHIPHFLLQ